jgi:ubiquinone biosynthesis protein UbiJ
METPSPFSLLEGVFQNFQLPFAPPAWAVEEAQRKVLLLINHVLTQEPTARQRLARQKGRVVLARWHELTFKLVLTPAGLFDLAAPAVDPDLTLVVTQESVLDIARTLLAGAKPAVRIEGDVQLAAEINWLVDHVRWDLEDDLARVFGDVAAHTLVLACTSAARVLRQFVPQSGPRAGDGAGGASGPQA